MGGHVAVMPTENGHALTLELGSPDLNENLCPSVPVSSLGSVSGEAALSFREALPTCPCALCLLSLAPPPPRARTTQHSRCPLSACRWSA